MPHSKYVQVEKIQIKLRDILKERGMTQKELAVLTNIRESTISSIARNQSESINTLNLMRIMQELDITDFNEILEIKTMHYLR